MRYRSTCHLLPLMLSAVFLQSNFFAHAAEPPITGDAVEGFEAVDKAVLDFMQRIDCTAGTVAIMRDGELLYSRGFGWRDSRQRVPTPPDLLMRVASVTKPITATAVYTLIESGKLDAQAKVFELLDIKPKGGKLVDQRVMNITVQQLLDHTGGWDREKTFDPPFQLEKIKTQLRLKRPVTPVNVIEFMLTHDLQSNPGEKRSYSNLGYIILGRVIEKVTGKSYEESINDLLLKPLEITEIKVGHSAFRRRDKNEVYYPIEEDLISLEALDACGGLIASAPALCKFMDRYWLNGKPRRKGYWGVYHFFGSLPGTTAMVRQRKDRYHFAAVFNGRRREFFQSDNDALMKSMDAAVDSLAKTKANIRP